MYISFENMPADSRVWVYQSNRPFTGKEQSEISELTEQFVDTWAAHNTPLKSSFKIFYHQFLVLLVDEGQNAASGCSIDASVHLIKTLEQNYNISFFDRTRVAFYENDKVILVPLSDLKSRIAEGAVTAQTLTFNNLVKNKRELHDQWLVPTAESWLKRYFKPIRQL